MENVGKFIISVIKLLMLMGYCWLIYKKKISPSIAMWVFFTLAVLISLTTYLSVGNYSLLDNILNTTDLILVVSVTIIIFFLGDKTTKFNRFDIGCLVGVLIIIIFWIITKNHFMSHLLIQLIMIIAYFPVINRMLKHKKNTEPFLMWIGILITSIISLFVSSGTLAFIYAIRAIICTGTLLILMVILEIKYKNKEAESIS